MATESGKHVFVVGLTLHVARVLIQMGVLSLIKETSRFGTRNEALHAAVDLLKKNKDILSDEKEHRIGKPVVRIIDLRAKEAAE